MQVNNINFSYGSEPFFSNFSCEFADGKVSVIVGKSGVGKTTLLSCIAGLYGKAKPVRCSYVFQQGALVPELSVFDNISLVLLGESDKTLRKQKVQSILSAVGLDGKERCFPCQLSEGERARVGLARAFAFNSNLLLMDEPFRALDYATKKVVMECFAKLLTIHAKTVIFVTHSVDEALLLGQEFFCLHGKPCQLQKLFSVDFPVNSRDIFSAEFSPLREKLLSAYCNE